MASGSFELTRYGDTSSYAYFPVRWSSYSNGSAANSSTVDVAVYIAKKTNSTSPTWGTANTSVSVSGGGTLEENGLGFSVDPGKETLLFAKSFTVPHADDGTRTTTISANVGGNVAWAKGEAEITLDTIPRAALLLTAPNFTDEENPTITYNNLAGEAVDSVQIGILDINGEVQYADYREMPKTESSYTFVLTDAEREALRNAVLNDTSTNTAKNEAYVRFYIKTYINGEIVEDPRYLQRKVTVVNSSPEIDPWVEDLGSASTALTNNSLAMIKGFNYVNASMSVTTKKGASIVSKSIQNGNTIVNALSGNFNNTEHEQFLFTVTDSYGNTAATYYSIEFIEYIKLTCDLSPGNPNTEGEMSVKISGNYFNQTFGRKGDQNVLTVQWRMKENNGDYSAWTTVSATVSDTNTYEAIFTINIDNFNPTSSYTIQAMAKDLLNTSGISSVERTVRNTPVFNWGESNFDINVDVNLTNKIQWKEENFGDKFAITTDFNGFNDDNKLKIQASIGDYGTDPELYDVVTVTGQSGYVTAGGYYDRGCVRLLPAGTDDVNYWCTLQNGWYWHDVNYQDVDNLPSSWGFVEKRGFIGGDFTVTYYTQGEGAIYRKSGNPSYVTEWRTIYEEPQLCSISTSGTIDYPDASAQKITGMVEGTKSGSYYLSDDGIIVTNTKILEVSGQLAGYGGVRLWIDAYCDGTFITGTRTFLHQGGGNGYYSIALPISYLELDPTKTYHIAMYTRGYNATFSMNSGFETNATRLNVRKIK